MPTIKDAEGSPESLESRGNYTEVEETEMAYPVMVMDSWTQVNMAITGQF
jgi:hypothetical protein